LRLGAIHHMLSFVKVVCKIFSLSPSIGGFFVYFVRSVNYGSTKKSAYLQGFYANNTL